MTSEEYLYKPNGHFSQAFLKLTKLREDKQLCDVLIRIRDRLFYAHKIIMISCCPYFEAMFQSGMTETRQHEITLQDIDPTAFEAILDLIYNGSVNINIENVQAILSASSIFQIDHLKAACSNFLKKQLAPHNCLGIKSFAEAHGCTDLVEHAHKHTMCSFTEVVLNEEYLALGCDQVMALLSYNELRINSEEEVFDALTRWMDYDLHNRAKHIAELLRLVRLPLLSPSVLADKVRANELIRQNLECRDLLDEALISYHLLPDRRSTIPHHKTRPRKCTFDMGIIYAVGGLNSNGGTLSSVERFDSSKGQWQLSKSMQTLRSRVGVAVVDGKLYAFGGYDGTSRLCTVECYDPQRDEWQLRSSMNTRRSAMSIAVHGHDVHIIGGYDGSSSLYTVEVYQPDGDEWRFTTSMHTCRSAAGAAVLADHIYVVGGHDGLSIFNTVERYDPSQRLWTMVTPMQTRRCRVGLTAAAGRLYTLGGYDGQAFLNTMECYDPSTDQWSRLPPMSCRRSRVGVVAIANKIYAVGGYDGFSNLSSVEVYHLERGEWSSSTPMNQHQGGVGVAVISLD